MLKRLTLACALAGLLTLARTAGAQTTFASNDLNGTSGSNVITYTPAVGGPFALAEGTPLFAANSPNDAYATTRALAYSLVPMPTRNVTLQADVDVVSSGTGTCSLILEDASGNYYRSGITYSGSTYYNGINKANAADTDQALTTYSGDVTGAPAVGVGGTEHIKVTYNAGVFALYLNNSGTATATATDTTYTPVRVGIDLNGSTATTGLHMKNVVFSYTGTVQPVASPATAYSNGPTAVSLSSPTAGATIYYTLDGTTPTTSSAAYSAPVSVPPGATLKSIASLSGVSSTVTSSAYFLASYAPGTNQYDVTGNGYITNQGGSVSYFGGLYYWYGENRTGLYTQTGLGTLQNQTQVPVGCYTSPDLLNWTFVGNVLTNSSPTMLIERPKVLYNSSTSTYVLICHYDDFHYTTGQVRIATSSSPTGPFTWSGASFSPDGNDSRDIGVFQDPVTGTAYLIYASSTNTKTLISQLNSSYTGIVSSSTVDTGLGAREGFALLHAGSLYYLLSSGVTGWSPNVNQYATASSLAGPWTNQGNFCQVSGQQSNATAYTGQTYFAFPVVGTQGYVWCASRYVAATLQTSTNVWLPLTINGTALSVSWLSPWTPTPTFTPAVLPAAGQFKRGR